MKTLVVLVALMIAGPLWGSRVDTRYWAKQFHGCAEVVLADGTRCDVLTDDYAFEVERAPNWMEAVGQALHYAQVSGRKPGIVLLVRPGEERHLSRLIRLNEEYKLGIYIEVEHEN